MPQSLNTNFEKRETCKLTKTRQAVLFSGDDRVSGSELNAMTRDRVGLRLNLVGVLGIAIAAVLAAR